jgi:hypothetical protein
MANNKRVIWVWSQEQFLKIRKAAWQRDPWSRYRERGAHRNTGISRPRIRVIYCKGSARTCKRQSTAEHKLPAKGAANNEEINMQKTLLAILGSALIVASSIQIATAAEHPAEHHKARKTSLRPAMANEQFRVSYNELLRDANPYELCGLFPGPCQ